MKVCVRCSLPKSLEAFPTNRRSSDGHSSWCRACFQDDRDTNRKAFLQTIGETGVSPVFRCSACVQMKSATEFHKNKASKTGWMNECKACCKSRYVENGDAIRARQRAYNKRVDPAVRRVAQRQWVEENRDAQRAISRRSSKLRTARKALTNPDVKLRPSEWWAIVFAAEWKCHYCDRVLNDTVPAHHADRLTQDHLIPISRGGMHTASNVVPACWPCNEAKGTLTADEFLAARSLAA